MMSEYRNICICQYIKFYTHFRAVLISYFATNDMQATSAYADDVNILGGSIRTVKENAEALVVATKEIGLEVNADKTKYMVMSREQTAGLSHTMKVDNSSIERVEEFKYLGTTLTNSKFYSERH